MEPAHASSTKTDSLLLELDHTLDQQATYDQQRLNRLAVLTSEYYSDKADDTTKFDLALLIYNEYQVFKYDSAFAYSLRLAALARKLHSPSKLQTARTKMAFTLRSAGLFKDTFDTLKVINSRQLLPGDKADFYEIYSVMTIELGEYEGDTYFQPLYTRQSFAYADTAARYARAGSYAQLSQLLFRARQQHDLRAGKALYAQLRRLALTPHQIAVVSSTLARIYEHAGQHDAASQLMVLAAINDIKSATKEGIALFYVANYCYQRGDLERAHRYISEAKKAAAFFKARHRLVQMSPLSSLIDGQKIAVVENQRQQAKTYALVIGLLAALVLGFACISYVQLQRLKKAGRLLLASNQELHQNNEKLQKLNHTQQELNSKLQELNNGLNEANRIKEEYIGYYFSNTSRYIDKLEALKNKLGTLLNTKQVTAAQRLVEDLDIKSERADLFKGFDTVFIELFPNFVSDFNSLFTEADRIYLAQEQLLTTELRIFALIRLGITDSEQISRILGYSINTVYAYKTKVKNRSFLPNEVFEARVLAIQAS